MDAAFAQQAGAAMGGGSGRVNITQPLAGDGQRGALAMLCMSNTGADAVAQPLAGDVAPGPSVSELKNGLNL